MKYGAYDGFLKYIMFFLIQIKPFACSICSA